jgi:hypothetical protein
VSTIGPTRPPVIQPPTNEPLVPPGSLPWERGGGVQPSISDQIVAILGKGTGGGAQALFVADAQYISHVSGAVDTWADSLDLWPDAVQATGSAKPAFQTGIFGAKSGVAFDGGDSLVTAAMNLSSFERGLVMATFLDSTAALSCVVDFCGGADGQLVMLVNATSAGGASTAATLTVWGRRVATGVSSAFTAASYAMTAAGVVHGTVDYTLSTNASTVYHDGADVTGSRPLNDNISAASLGNGALSLGMLVGGGNGLTGKLRSVLIAAWPTATAFPTSAIAQVVALLKKDASIA